MHIKLILALGVLMLSCSNRHLQKLNAGEKAESFQRLSDEFGEPPTQYRPGAFWCWLNGNMSNTSITRDLEAMKSKGINRAEIWDVAAVKNPVFIPAGGHFLETNPSALSNMRYPKEKD